MRFVPALAALSLTAGLIGVAAPSEAEPRVAEPPKQATAHGSGGAVTSVDPYATQIGLRVLRAGGNATDAAVATAAALGVTEPFSAGIGGGDLAAQFAEAGLLDEVVVSIAPVTVGSGKPLFPRRFDLELLEVDRNKAFVCARYRVVGPRLPPG